MILNAERDDEQKNKYIRMKGRCKPISGLITDEEATHLKNKLLARLLSSALFPAGSRVPFLRLFESYIHSKDNGVLNGHGIVQFHIVHEYCCTDINKKRMHKGDVDSLKE